MCFSQFLVLQHRGIIILKATPSAAGPLAPAAAISILASWGTILDPREHAGGPFWHLGATLEDHGGDFWDLLLKAFWAPRLEILICFRACFQVTFSISESKCRRLGLMITGFRMEGISRNNRNRVPGSEEKNRRLGLSPAARLTGKENQLLFGHCPII